MSFGVRVGGPSGLLELDENSFTVRIIYSAIVQSGAGQGRSRFISIAGVTPATHSAVCVPIAAYDTTAQLQTAIQYTPIVTNGGITVYYGYPGRDTGPIGLSAQRLLVMRYR